MLGGLSIVGFILYSSLNLFRKGKRIKKEDEINCEESLSSSEDECTKILKETEKLELSSEDSQDSEEEDCTESDLDKKP